MMKVAVFGGGCFWCTEAVFTMLKGIISVLPGYAGGSLLNPTYEQICGWKTGHAEVIRIEYNPSLISYHSLLTVFFATHDPTALNQQGNDVGPQYRSVIFYSNEDQKKEAEEFIKELDASSKDGKPIVTAIEPLANFYEAEDYHKNYYAKNKGNPYCEVVINQKLQKVQEEFAALLNTS